MKHKKIYEPQSGKLVRKLPKGINFAYNLYLGHLRYHWKYLTKEKNKGTKQYLHIWCTLSMTLLDEMLIVL